MERQSRIVRMPMTVASRRSVVPRHLCGCLLVCLGPAIVLAQTSAGAVRGVVVGGDGTAVAGAVVTLLGSGDSTRTSIAGAFMFQRARAGPDSLSVRAVGFEHKVEQIRVSLDSGWVGRVALTRLAQALPQLNVTAPAEPVEFWKYDDFFRRQRLGFGTFRTRDDFERMGAVDIVSALRSISGVNVSTTGNPNGETEVRWRIARCPGQPPNIVIYINGLIVARTGASSNKGSELSGAFRARASRSSCEGCARMGDILSSLPLVDVMFIEFYRGPGQIPADIDRGDSCAALVIWTR